ncbi:hypothetical protein MPSEU_000297200 [Mayamaea pseudoterrestris]|nr:hypothetical protein MPSEU_000297200 [Mayamaea pseudoterrestris]
MRKYLLLCLVARTMAFMPRYQAGFAGRSVVSPSAKTTSAAFVSYRSNVQLLAEENQSSAEGESDIVTMQSVVVTPSPTQPAVAASKSEPELTSYPIDIPSPILLGTSMVLAISGTGSLFELLGGDPKLGFATTAAIAAVGLPACLFLFYAAILKAQAETVEDDKAFTSGRK